MKTRIKQMTFTYGDGHKEIWYRPQYRVNLIWWNFDCKYPETGAETFKTQEEAEDYLKKTLKHKIVKTK